MSTLNLPTISIPPSAGPQRAAAECAILSSSFRWLTRPRRILLLLAAVWVINVFDLGYTLLESLHAAFVELNPVAAKLLGISPVAVVAYKMGLTGISSSILLCYRRHRVSELGCWFLLTVHLYVAICWIVYYQHKLVCLCDPAVNVEPILGMCTP